MMLVMLRMVPRRVIVVGAGSAEKRATQAKKCERHIHETKFEAIQSSDAANGFRQSDP
jgi:fructoselysine-6-P-deglycase FrlB-like protein